MFKPVKVLIPEEIKLALSMFMGVGEAVAVTDNGVT